MSRLMMLPPGPEPWIEPMSTPFSLAIRRANGEDFARPPPLSAAGAAPADGAGCCGGVPAVFSCGGVEASPWDCLGDAGTGEAPAFSCACAATCAGSPWISRCRR